MPDVATRVRIASLRSAMLAWGRDTSSRSSPVAATSDEALQLRGDPAQAWARRGAAVVSLPGIELGDSETVQLRVTWRSRCARLRRGEPLGLRVFFVDHRGHRLRDADPVDLTLAGGRSHRWQRTDTAPIPVPMPASGLRVDFRQPGRGSIEVRNLEIMTPVSSTRGAPVTACRAIGFREELTGGTSDLASFDAAGIAERLSIEAVSAGGPKALAASVPLPRDARDRFLVALIGQKGLPSVTLTGPVVALTVRWRAIDALVESMPWKIRLHWTDARGRLGVTEKPTVLQCFADRPGVMVTDHFPAVPVPDGARGVRIDPLLPWQMHVDVSSIDVGAPVVQRIESPSQELAIGDADDIAIPSGRGALVRAGAIIDIPGVDAVVVDDDEPLAMGAVCRRGNMADQAIRLRSAAGPLTVQLPMVDLRTIERVDGGVRVTLDAFNLNERSVPTIGEFDPDDVREHPDLALAEQQGTVATIPVVLHDRPIGPLAIRPAPDGRAATLVLTEHADRQSVASERAVMDEGLLPRRIPISKSVFLCGYPPGEDVPAKPVCAVDEDPDFAARVAAYAARDDGLVELALHTAGPRTVPTEDVKRALDRHPAIPFRGWIDHGRKRNRSCLTRSGALREHPAYVGELLHEYGMTWAWTYRDHRIARLNLVGRSGCSRILTDLRIGPTPMHLFSTVRVECRRDDLGADRLDELIAARGVSLIHCYLSINQHGHLVEPGDGTVHLAAWFQSELDGIAARAEAGTLWVTTLGAFAQRVSALRRLRFDIAPEGLVIVNDGAAIGGVTIDVDHRDGPLIIDLPSGRTLVEEFA